MTLAQWAKRHGPTDEVLKALRDAGWSQRRAGKLLGMTQTGISSRAKRNGWSWPASDTVRVWLGNRYGSVADAARISGVDYGTVYYRVVVLGWGGDKAMKPVGGHSRKGSSHYEVGLSADEWRVILAELDEEDAKAPDRTRARQRIANRRHLPYGAISAADQGEWDRLG